MPRIRRWFPVSHDINRDPEVWALTEKFSDKALRIWLECLSIADRNEGVVTRALDDWCRAVTFLLRTHHRRTTEVVAEFLRLGWLVLDEDHKTVRVAKYAEYHQTREKIKSHKETKEVPTILPSEPSLLNSIATKKPRLEKGEPEWKEIADIIYNSDPKRFARLMQLINWAAKEMYSDLVIRAGLEKLWRALQGNTIQNWWPYARKCLEKAYTEDQQAQSIVDKREGARFVATLIKSVAK